MTAPPLSSPPRSRSPLLSDQVLPTWIVLLVTTVLALAVATILLLPSGIG